MSKKDFKEAYVNADIKKLKKYINNPKILSTKDIVKYMGDSLFKPKLFSIMIQISFSHYNFNQIVSAIIKLDNVELLEKVLAYDDSRKLDINLIQETVPKGRISMAKIINEYINGKNYGKDYELMIVRNFIEKYKFVYNPNEKSIDSFILAIYKRDVNGVKNIIPNINPNFWNDFPIRFCVECYTEIYPTPDYLDIIKELLNHPLVDPGTDDNFALKKILGSYIYGFSKISNEFLKHHLVNVTNITHDFVEEVVRYNFSCVAERFLRSKDNNIIKFFKDNIDFMIRVHNDVTYLAIKLGIFDVNKLLQEYPDQEKQIKRHLKKLRLNNPYVIKPYNENLDPEQIYIVALESDDIGLAKTIITYPVSIDPQILFHYLLKYKEGNVHDYIWTTIIKEYDLNRIFLNKSLIRNCWRANCLNKLFNIVKNDPRFDFQLICSYQFDLDSESSDD